MTEKVEVRVEDRSVEVLPQFYGVALGILKMGIPLIDVYDDVDDDEFFCLVFMDPDQLEHFSSFLLSHGMFPQESGRPAVRGGFRIEAVDGDLISSYCVDVPRDHLDALSSCLLAHFPESPGSVN